MTRKIKLLCLANSDKHNNRCVAGLDIKSGEWIRPISRVRDGRLFEKHYITREGHDPNPLDILEISVTEPEPSVHQPENWRVTDKDWRLLNRKPTKEALKKMEEKIDNGPEIFGDEKYSVEFTQIKESPMNDSLVLIKPDQTYFYLRERRNKPVQPRAQFNLNDVEYDFPVTDPTWKKMIRSDDILSSVELRYEPASAYIDENKEILFTVSLGSPTNGTCYKLVAAVIPISASKFRNI